jgi:hypothetical protein
LQFFNFLKKKPIVHASSYGVWIAPGAGCSELDKAKPKLNSIFKFLYVSACIPMFILGDLEE